METELQQAERTAKAWLEWPAVPEVATLARVFLAQQARLAGVEREGARTDVPLSINLNNTVEVTLTDAGIKARQKHWEGYTIKPEFARVWRTQLWWLMSELGNATFLGGPNLIENNEVRVIANRPTPPQAAPEPLRFTVTEWADRLPYITLTPEDCRRIVAMAGFPVPEEGGR